MGNLVTIYTFSYPHEAAIIQGRIEADGIPTFLKDELTVQTYHFYSNAIGGIKLQVREEDAEQAIAILAEAGYKMEVPEADVRLLNWLDKMKARTPLLKNSGDFTYMAIVLTIVILVIGGIGYLIFRPTLTDKLTANKWCVDYVIHQGVEYNPFTINDDAIRFLDGCEEQMVFYGAGKLSLPGFNSDNIIGGWYIHDGQLRMKNLSAYGNVYDGLFNIKMDGDLLILSNDSTTIYSYKIVDFYQRFRAW